MINVPINKILFLDIETVGLCKDWSSCQESNPKIAEQFVKYFDWFLKRFPEDNIETSSLEEEMQKMNDVYAKRTALVPEFAKIVCVSGLYAIPFKTVLINLFIILIKTLYFNNSHYKKNLKYLILKLHFFIQNLNQRYYLFK